MKLVGDKVSQLFKLKQNIFVSILSLIYSLIFIFGTSYMKYGNAKIVFDHLILSILIFTLLFFISRWLILLLFNLIDNKVIKNKKLNKFEQIFNDHPFIVSLVIILVLWLPYIIAFYPIILSPDPSYQIKQYFGIPNKYLDYAILLDKNVTITNHHPVIHTLLLGTSLKIGHSIGNDNLGLFIYSVIQILILSSVLSFTIKYMKNINTPIKYRVICLFIYSLVPMFPMYAMSGVKDTIFTALIILYTILCYHLSINKNINIKLKQLFVILVLFIFIILFRNNGFHIILLSFPFVILFSGKNFKKLLSVFVLFLIFNYSYNNIILPGFKVTPTSKREVFSIPFQQTARYVKYHDLTDEEYEVYDKVLDMSDLGERYKPEISDPVKNKYNKYTTDKELNNYFKMWFKDLLKDPVLYIDATINNTYGYFYPFKTNWYVYHKYDTRIVKDGFDYHYNNLSISRNILSKFAIAYPFIPILGLISNIGFNTLILLFMVTYLMQKNKYRGIIYLLPSFVALFVCVASPVNAYFRYAMPYVFAMPLLIGLFYNYIKECD